MRISGKNRRCEIVQANDEDHPLIGQYLAQQAWPGPVEMATYRAQDFTLLYRAQTADFETHLIKDPSGKIRGMFSILFKEGYIEGTLKRYAMISDLRITPTGPALRALLDMFWPIAQRALEIRNVEHLFCIISPAQEHLLDSLLRPMSHVSELPRFALVRKLEIVAIHGKWPFTRPLKKINIRPAKAEDLSVIGSYLKSRSETRLLGEDFNGTFLESRLGQWPNFNIGDLKLAFDQEGTLVGCVGLWNPSALQIFKVKRFRGIGRTAASTLGWLPRLGLGSSLPRKNEFFDLLFLTHLMADNVDILEALLHYSLKMKQRSELLIYTAFEDCLLTLPPLSLITTRVPMSLFTLAYPNRELPSYLKFNMLTPPPEIEAALL